jgi:exodeoxyribonuclease V beta subunit
MTLTSYSGLTRHTLSVDLPFQRWLEEGEEETSNETLEEDGIEQAAEDDLPAGASFGKLVHDFLEMTDFAQPDWQDLTRRWQTFVQDPEAELPKALEKLVRQTLAGDCQPFRLADLPAQSTYKEHHFVLHAPKMDLSALNGLMSFRPDWQAVEPARVHGYLQGFIDLIAEVNGKYYILDYKTNRLQDYSPASLQGAMREHHYALQALIYTLALDAHLRTFKQDYQPEVHLGGVRYLFMRGMRENATDGVYVLNFDEDTLKQARQALTGEEA